MRSVSFSLRFTYWNRKNIFFKEMQLARLVYLAYMFGRRNTFNLGLQEPYYLPLKIKEEQP